MDLQLPEDNRILFHRRDRQSFGFLSNFHVAPVTIDGTTWPSTEHYYQAQKSHSREYQRIVLEAVTPAQAKRLGNLDPGKKRSRKNSWFTGQKKKIRPDWDKIKLSVMETALIAKFEQHPRLRQGLINTCDAELVEDSRSDTYWGAGEDGAGDNRLGKLLMKIRDRLRKQ